MSRIVSSILAFGLVSLVWMSLIPQASHGQIAFAPPRGANAISPTMPAPDRPAPQSPEPVTETAAKATSSNGPQPSRETRAVSTDLQPEHYAAAPAPYSSLLYPAYLRSLNLRGEESEPWVSPEAAHSPGNATTRSIRPASGRWPQDVATHIQVASYRVGQQR